MLQYRAIRAGNEGTGERSNLSTRYTSLDQTEGPDPCPKPHPLHCWQWRPKISAEVVAGSRRSSISSSGGSSMPLPVGGRVYFISCLALANEEKLNWPSYEHNISKICHSWSRPSIYIIFGQDKQKGRTKHQKLKRLHPVPLRKHLDWGLTCSSCGWQTETLSGIWTQSVLWEQSRTETETWNDWKHKTFTCSTCRWWRWFLSAEAHVNMVLTCSASFGKHFRVIMNQGFISEAHHKDILQAQILFGYVF